jgi:hypothetical protein
LKDPATPLDKIDQLPEGKTVELLEIELPKETPIPSATFQLIKQVRSLKRLVVAIAGLSDRERSELKAALPELKIETPQ